MNDGRSRDGELDLSDLPKTKVEGPERRFRAPEPDPEAKETVSFAGERVLGDGFEDVKVGTEIGLDIDPDAFGGRALPLPSLDDPPFGPTSMNPRAAASIPVRGPASLGDSVPREEAVDEHAPDPEDVARVADFGAPPSNVFGVLPYAVLVTSRRLTLKKQLADLRRLHTVAVDDEGRAMIELGRALHAQKANPALAPLAAMIAEADARGARAGERTEQWEKSRVATSVQRNALAEKIKEAERKAAPFRNRESKLQTELSISDNDLRRARAMLSRAEIEIRNLGNAGSEDPTRRAHLEAERSARQADVDAARGPVDTARAELAAIQRELSALTSAINDLEAQTRALMRTESHADDVYLASANEAEARYHEAVAEIAEHCLGAGLAASISPDATRSAEAMRGAREARERELALHEAALDAYDPDAYRKGMVLIGIAGALVLAMIVLAIFG